MSLDLSCPHCDRTDWVQSVPAAVSEGTHSGYSTGVHTGVGIGQGGLVPVIGTSSREVSHSSALARSLALAPVLPTPGRLTAFAILLMLPTAMFFAAAALGFHTDPPEGNPVRVLASLAGMFAIPIVWSIPVVALLAAAVKRARRNGRVASGRARAHSVWQGAYYCHRCGLAFWPQSMHPGIPSRVGVPPGEFRWYVWNVGGYAKL
ncbi:hypothetical protein ACWF9G_27330 [Nocardia sp. NPDC055029]